MDKNSRSKAVQDFISAMAGQITLFEDEINRVSSKKWKFKCIEKVGTIVNVTYEQEDDHE
jgi:hypothetical protein